MSELKCGDWGRSDEHCIADCLKTLKQQLAQQKELLDDAMKVIEWYKDGYGVSTDDSYIVHVGENCHYRRSGGKRTRAFLSNKEINQILGKEEGENNGN